MPIITTIVISLAVVAVLFCLTGLWLSMPATMRFAPPQTLIDALPAWLQGPRRIAPTVKDEPVTPVLGRFSSSYAVLAELEKHFSEEAMPAVTPAPVEEEHSEAAQAEVVHDEP